MNERTPLTIYLFLVLFLTLSFVIHPAFGETTMNTSNITNDGNGANNSLTIAEQDILSFKLSPNINAIANVTLVIHHEVWVINNDYTPVNIALSSPIPKDKYTQDSTYTTFGNNSLMEDSIIPSYFNLTNVKVLDDPAVEIGADQVDYIWNNVTIAPKSAVLASYSNYYGNDSDIYKSNEIDLPGATITRNYENNGTRFVMNYTIKNADRSILKEPKFSLFFPEIVNGIQLIRPSHIIVNSSEMEIIGNMTFNDGTGYFSKGVLLHSLTNVPNSIGVSDELFYPIEINSTIENRGKIMPSMIIWYLSDSSINNETGDVTRIWPATTIVSNNKINVTRFYYYEVSVFVPETNYFTVSPSDNPSTNIPVLLTVFALILAVAINKRKHLKP